MAILLILVSVFMNSINAQAKTAPIQSTNQYKILRVKDDCSKTKDPDAPCRGEVFTIEPTSLALSVTCGVNVFTLSGTKVATLSETVSFTTGASSTTYTVNSASRSTWVKNSSYQWKGLNGPTPNTGTVYFGSGPSTYGDLYYLGGYWNTWRTTLIVSSPSSWYCQ